MKTLTCKELQECYTNIGEKIVRINGRIKTLRVSKTISFIELNDGSTLNNSQLVIKLPFKSIDINSLTLNSVISVDGKIVATPNRNQPFEIQVQNLRILSLSERDFLLQKKEHSLEFLREIQEYRVLTNYFQHIFRLKQSIINYIRDFLESRNFMWAHTPILTTNDAEGAGESFSISTEEKDESFFGKSTYLTVSGQLNVEALAQAYNRVYTFGPTFRADLSNTPFHVSEFWMLEPELAYCEMSEGINFAVELLNHVGDSLIKHNMSELNYLSKVNETDLKKRLECLKNVKKISYKEAIKLINDNESKKAKKPHLLKFGDDLQKEHEKWICSHFKSLIVLTNFPLATSPFYMYDNGDKTSRSFDILLDGIGEVIGGSQREDRFDYLMNQLKKNNLEEKLGWYLDLRKYGYAPSTGFGLGLERLVMYLTGVKNIKDVQFFPRSYGQIKY